MHKTIDSVLVYGRHPISTPPPCELRNNIEMKAPKQFFSGISCFFKRNENCKINDTTNNILTVFLLLDSPVRRKSQIKTKKKTTKKQLAKETRQPPRHSYSPVYLWKSFPVVSLNPGWGECRSGGGSRSVLIMSGLRCSL